MDTREKLIELLTEIDGICPNEENCYHCKYDNEEYCFAHSKADLLIDNGVTVQEWISVNDMLPEESGLYITYGCTAVPVRWLHNFDKDIGKFGAWWNYEPDGKEHPQYRFIEAGNITHWMQLPEPPKGD